MWTFYTFLVSFCLILLSQRICTEGPIFQPSENGRAESHSQGHGSSLNDDSPDLSNGATPDSHPLPDAPFPVTHDGKEEEADLVPPTPTANSIIVVGGGAGGVAAVVSLPDIEDASTMDTTGHKTDSLTDITETDGVPKTVPSQGHVPGSTDGKEKTDGGDDSQSATLSQPTEGSAPMDSPVSTESEFPNLATGAERSKVVRLPSATQTLDDFLQTEVFETSNLRIQRPSSEVDSSSFDPLQATEALKSIDPGTWESLSELPVGVGGMAVEPPTMQDAVLSTQFSVGGRKFGMQTDDELGLDGKKKEEGEFPTFDKWSVQYLAEQEKQKIEKEQEQATQPGSVLAQKKLRQNFAAAGCGAKVVASNAEAENINYLLNGNPDEYMLSPCKAKKWFVVELCEPVQIHKVDLGTMELFSSQPKSFRLFASQRFPSKEWISLGKFDMTPERVVQSFQTQVTEEFVKFVKVEMLEHHGDEHYCPVTTFRVLGIDMASEEDDENDHETVETDGDTALGDLEEDEAEGSVNLFTSAKETVVKLVQKVLYKGDQEATPEEGHKKGEELTPADNATSKSEEKKGEVGKPEEPCSHSPGDGPSVQVPQAGVIPPPTVTKEAEELPIVTKLADTEQLPMDTTKSPVVIKLEHEADDSTVTTSTIATTCPSPQQSGVCFHSPWSSYTHMLKSRKLMPSTCAQDIKSSPDVHVEKTVAAPEASVSVSDETKTAEGPGASVTKEHHAEEQTADTQKSKSVPPPVQEESTIDGIGIGKVDKDHEAKISKPHVTDKTGGQSSAAKLPPPVVPTDKQAPENRLEDSVVSSQSTSFTSAGVSSTKSENLEPSSLTRQADLENEAVSVLTPGLDIQQSQVVEQGASDISDRFFLKVSPSPTISSEDSLGEGDMLLETPTAVEREDNQEWADTPQLPADADTKLEVPSPGTQPHSGHVSTQEFSPEGPSGQQILEPSKPQGEVTVNTTNGEAVYPGSKPSKPDLVKVGMPSSAKRDTSLMKLNNRILALEQNVSMTKKYLEELSRAFKQQNEEMMKLLNKTEQRLSVHIAQAEERDLHQQARIDVLEQKVANLTKVVDAMQLHMDTMSKELRDGQFLLVLFQVLLFLWMIVSSYRSRPTAALAYTDHQFLLDTMPTKPTIEPGEAGGRQRRNSDVGVSSSSDQASAIIKRQRSETNLAKSTSELNDQDVYDGSGSLSLHGTSQAAKKKKKKKLKHQQLSMDVVSLSTSSACGTIPTQCSSFSSSAGVLFGTDGSSQSRDRHLADCTVKVLNGNKENMHDQRMAGLLDGRMLGRLQDNSINICKPSVGPDVTFDFGSSKISGDVFGQNMSNSACIQEAEVGERVVLPGLSMMPTLYVCTCDGQVFPQPYVTSSYSRMSHSPVVDAARKNSPEFELPSYHRNKIRKVGDGSYATSRGGSLKHPRGRHFGVDGIKRRSSTDFLNPVQGQELFLAENYMSENRFKFPASPAKGVAISPQHSPYSNFQADDTEHGFSVNGGIDMRYPPMMSCSSQHYQPLISTSLPGSRCRSASPLSSLSIFSAPSTTSLPHSRRSTSPPASSALTKTDHRSPTHPVMVAPPPHAPPTPPHSAPPYSLAQLSSQSLSRVSSGATRTAQSYHRPQHHPLGSITQALEPGPIISSGTAPKGNIHIHPRTETSKSGAHVTIDAGPSKPAYVNQTHRRQGSFPLDQHRGSKSMEKEPARTRQGSFEGSKHAGKLGSGQQQGSKVKKSPSHSSLLNRKGSASKSAPTDKPANQPSATSKKGPKS